MSKGLWILIGTLVTGGLVFAGIKVAQKGKESQNIYNKIKYTFSNLKMRLSNWVVSVSVDIDVTNLSTITIPVKNLSVVAQYKKDNVFIDLAYTKTPISGFTLKANATTKITGLTMAVGMGTAAWSIFQALIGKVSEIKLITSYYVSGFELKDEQIIPIKTKQSTVSGLGEGNDELILEPVEGIYGYFGCTCPSLSKLIA